VCTEAGMFALRERRVHVTQEDFEITVAKVMKKDGESNISLQRLWIILTVRHNVHSLVGLVCL
jgi:26S proteasome regulatory subunit T6